MSILANCPCGARFAARDDLAGQVVRCPSCGRAFQVSPSNATRTAPTAPWAPTSYGGGPHSYQGWQAGPAAQRPQVRTAVWVAVGAAVVAVVALMIVGLVVVAWTTGRGPIAQPILPGSSAEATSATPDEDPSMSYGDVPSALPRGPARNVGDRHGDVAPIKWTAVPDPAPAPPYEVEPIELPERVQLQRVVFSSAATGQAMLQTTIPGDRAHHALLRIDLKSGERLAGAVIDSHFKLLALSPDGESVLIDTSSLNLGVLRWQGDSLRQVGRIALDRLPGNIIAHFFDNGHVVLFDSSNRGVSGWEVASGRRLYFVESRHAALALSPGGRYFAVRQFYGDTLGVYQTATGKRAGTVRAPRTGEQRIATFAFRPDGKILAALVQGDDNSRRLICWDAATGLIADYIPMTRASAGVNNPLTWLDNRFVGVHSSGTDGVSLLDLANHDHVWTYTAERPYENSVDKIDPDPCGRIWIERSADSDFPAAVVPLVLPDEAERKAIEQAYAGPAVLKPGDAVALTVRLEGAVPANGRADAEHLHTSAAELLQKKLTKSGIRVDDGAALQFQAVATYEIDPDKMMPIRVWYDGAVGLSNYHEIQVPRETVRLELSIQRADGTTPWRRSVVCTTDAVGPVEGLPNAQLKNEPYAAAARGPWLEAQGWLEHLQLPREFRRQLGEPLETTKIP